MDFCKPFLVRRESRSKYISRFKQCRIYWKGAKSEKREEKLVVYEQWISCRPEPEKGLRSTVFSHLKYRIHLIESPQNLWSNLRKHFLMLTSD